MTNDYNCIVLLGPTAVGKTSLGVRLAHELNAHIISADSRQVYKGLDIGSGKDLKEYNYNGKQIPYHLIDITDLSFEYNLYHYQTDFCKVFEDLKAQRQLPLVVGGTGMYIDSIVRGYEMVYVPENQQLRDSLESKSLEELDNMLLQVKPDLHNRTDLEIRDRVIRALEIAYFMNENKDAAKNRNRPKISPFILGTTIERTSLRKNIQIRLKERLDEGMIEEVKALHDSGFSYHRLERLGLEYKFVAEYLQGKFDTYEDFENGLYTAICRFAKRQETWFRGMEKKGVKINWISSENDKDIKFSSAMELIKKVNFV